MRILQVTPYLAPIYGGVTRVIESLIPALGREGVEVDLISTVAAGPEQLTVPTEQWIQGENHRRCYFASGHRNDLVWSSSMLQWLASFVRNYEVIHTHTIFSPLMSAVASLARVQRVPYVMTPHGMLDPWALRYKANRKRPYWFLWEQRLMRGANFVHGLHSEERNQLQQRGVETPMVVASNGIPEEAILPNQGGERFYQRFPELREKQIILFLSRIDPKKGLDLLIPAFVKVRSRFPQAHLVLAGPDTIGYREVLAPLLPSEGVTFVGMLEGEMKRGAFAAAACFILPSYSEGFSMAALESLAAGVPTLLSAECHFPEAVTQGVVRKIPLEISGIAKGLETILSHPDEAQAMGKRASVWVRENYTWAVTARTLIAAYQRGRVRATG